MEGVKEIGSIGEFGGGEPGGFFISAFVASPSDEVLEFPAVSAG